MTDVDTFQRHDGERIAYIRRSGRGPGVVWLGGFKSEMTGTKARALDAWAAGRAFVRFDYFGHGASTGDFRNGTVTRWLGDTLAVLDSLTEGPQLLVGSSMGGWLAALAALARPERVAGLLLIAPALDFTEALLWASLDDAARTSITERGEWLRPSLYDPSPYPITRALIEDGRKHLLLGGPIDLRCPVRIIQGMADPDVAWQHAMRVMDCFGDDTELTLVKAGDHRLSKPHEIALILRTLDAMLAP
ncbi:MAG: alpha/beta hydrolase [Proteobacteria bacterium]|nr:alpha/beta hydrolase [Pseudomonadota bacterium]